MNDVTSIIVKIAVAVLLALVTKYLIPYFKTLRDDARWNRLINIVQVAVEAAEQMIHDKGEIKKEDVVKFVTEWLNAQNISVSAEEIDRLIEAAVYKMNNGGDNINVATYVNGEEVADEE